MRGLTFLFSATLALSATLSFALQPQVAKMLLPVLGGSPSVWNLCLVFFQGVLFLGYCFAHWLTSQQRLTSQVLLLMALGVVASLFCLPIVLTESSGPASLDRLDPFWWQTATLTMHVGLPFLIVSTTGPLLQHWFSRTQHSRASDPYFLYVASNAGSLLGLLSYPVLIEPFLRLQAQATCWSAGFATLLVLIALCALACRRFALVTGDASSVQQANHTSEIPVPPGRAAQWIFCAFVPSSLSIGVTTYLVTEIASVPLLWVLP